MNPEIKYTTNGKKVVVIGSLNSQEKIVQEIFIVNGAEIPSGEHFVVKSLHDAPAISWEEKNTKSIKENYEAAIKKFKEDERRLNLAWKDMQVKVKEKLNWAASFLKNVEPEHFQLLTDYIVGNIKWVVVIDRTPKIIPFEQFEREYEGQLRLISIFGRSDGNVTYAQGSYSDYSGSIDSFIPFTDYEEAFAEFKKRVLSKSITVESLKVAKENGFDFPEDQKQEFYKSQLSNLQKNIENYQKSIDSWQSAVNEYAVSIK